MVFRASNTTNETMSNANESIHSLRDDMHNAVNVMNNAGRKVLNMFHTATDEISHVSGKATGEIRTNPIRSSLIALGAGLFIGMLIRR